MGLFDWKPGESASGTQEAMFVDWNRRWSTLQKMRQTDHGPESLFDRRKDLRNQLAAWKKFSSDWTAGRKDASAMQGVLSDLKTVQDEATRENQKLLLKSDGTIHQARSDCYDAAWRDFKTLGEALPKCGLFPREAGKPLGWNESVGVSETPNVKTAQDVSDAAEDLGAAATEVEREAGKVIGVGTTSLSKNLIAGFWASLTPLQKVALVGTGGAAALGTIAYGVGQIKSALPDLKKLLPR